MIEAGLYLMFAGLFMILAALIWVISEENRIK